MSPNVTTRYYRAPEIIYGNKSYDEKIDIWGLGCTLAELVLHQPIFKGQTDINQLEIIFSIVGYPVLICLYSKIYGLKLPNCLIIYNLTNLLKKKVYMQYCPTLIAN
jgi:serine/threonine protein kinase